MAAFYLIEKDGKIYYEIYCVEFNNVIFNRVYDKYTDL